MTTPIPIRLELRGGNLEAFYDQSPVALVEGAAGTGKTFTILSRMNRHAIENPGYKGLITRKTAVTLASTCLKTLEDDVFYGWERATRRSVANGVHFFGGSANEPAAYVFTNGSIIAVGGMDQPSKILSSEWDEAFVNEATELTVEDVETLSTRMRKGTMGWNALVMDCNPSSRTHWLNVKCDEGKIHRIKTRLQDNPAYFEADGTPTQKGQAYLNTLDSLTGARYERLRLGLWVGVENAIYPHFSRETHIRDMEPGLSFVTGAIGVDYGRRHLSAAVVVSVDQFGRRWVREAWGEPSDDHGIQLMRQIGRLKGSYRIYRGMTDPNQDVLAGQLGFKLADGSAGSRNRRTQLVGRLFNTFPGGRVPPLRMELNEERFLAEFPQPPFNEPDSPGLLFVKGMPGIEELAEEIESYHEVFVQNDVKEDYVVSRIDDDLVASLEYACECLETVTLNFRKPKEEETLTQEFRRKYARQAPSRGGYIKV